ncbi:DegT/DnrJ/EryC1/StrS aminotransferase family protein [Clostridium botulinum C]|uniref:DegT/DnrJ/EryC1/StrS aminotransferase family protein n=3 Tax=Clostridium botulinum TaxID=1491 RepID=A0A9Q4TG21_CLOBO|nr:MULTISPECIES: DegT/DnrJ/EryC1/StrS aminotransferase family protein [Clostridium]EGO87028.1 capsular biosynthesis protein [Clostridium botulinum C str. Stockholm]EES90766.1 spore coat polysaccharide biosynthesis protein SpsC [Clostridium botulinum D str. 1873]KEI06696.1 capsular biosynthesis protein [Clostridium sp. K25]MBO3441078.1 DegT/DnrJ/EryC1/StrS aminotransferase family protein [Clostridium haemolyticum]MCD3195573.1 DegT/DnrJ/EryC1/StrS aminotransferase family protein [Clostridium bot
MSKKIPFSPPDISQLEIEGVIDTLKSGWITSGPKTAKFEEEIAKYSDANKGVAVSSATMGMELILKVLGIGGEGNSHHEIITTPYTYTSTSNVILHRGLRPKFVDVKKDSFLIDEQKIYDAITPNTKAIMTVDFAGVPVDYDKVREVIKAKNREDIVLISDSAHSFGAKYKGKKVGGQMDFHVFSYHAVKNLTTAEGGGITYNNNNFMGKEDLYKELKYTSLNGQTKDALSKMKAGAWQYDILTDGFKCNMPDIMAAIGLAQLERYDDMLKKRAEIFEVYTNILKEKDWAIISEAKNDIMETSYHLYPLRIKGFTDEQRSEVITMMAEKDIAVNVHFIPLPMFTLYKNLGYDIKDYPNAYAQYANEITLPVYSKLTLEDAEYVAKELVKCIEKVLTK